MLKSTLHRQDTKRLRQTTSCKHTISVFFEIDQDHSIDPFCAHRYVNWIESVMGVPLH